MELDKGKEQFIECWTSMGSSWGINRTMAQIHAFLMASSRPMNTDEIMKGLSISRGNVNMNVRNLMEWGLVSKSTPNGGRKEYFEADKDVWQAARKMINMRRQTELEPVVGVLKGLRKVEGEGKEAEEFRDMMKSMYKLANRTNKALVRLEKNQDSAVLSVLSKMLK